MNVCMYVRTQLVYLSYIPWDVACPGEYFCLSLDHPTSTQSQLERSARTDVRFVCVSVCLLLCSICVCVPENGCGWHSTCHSSGGARTARTAPHARTHTRKDPATRVELLLICLSAQLHVRYVLLLILYYIVLCCAWSASFSWYEIRAGRVSIVSNISTRTSCKYLSLIFLLLLSTFLSSVPSLIFYVILLSVAVGNDDY